MYVVKEQSDRYETVETIADGAMGTVLLARDRLLDRMVAIKTIKLQAASDPEERQRLQQALRREAQVVQLLSHPHIVNVYDLIDEGDDRPPSVVMEYVEGAALEAFLRGGQPLPLDFALSVVSQIAEALEHAHAMGVVHGDIKPGNILITAENEQVKLVDFGIARLLGLERRPDRLRFGTPRYASPELFQGHVTDHRSDLYSLGVVFYEMLTGRSPFHGRTAPEIAQEVARGGADLSEAALSEVPGALRAVLRRALEKDPAVRFQSARDVLQAIREPATSDAEGGAVITQDLTELTQVEPGSEEAAESSRAVSRDAQTPAMTPPPATRGAFKVVREPLPTRRLIWVAGGALALTLVLGLLLIWVLAPAAGIDAQFSREHRERLRVLPLLKEGHRLLRAGEPDVAARIFRRAEQLLPDHPGIVHLRRRAEEEAEDLANYQDHTEEIQALLQRSRRALDLGVPRRALTLAMQALALEPENPEARRLADAARSRRARVAEVSAAPGDSQTPSERSAAPSRPLATTASPQLEPMASRSPEAPTPVAPGAGRGDARLRETGDSEARLAPGRSRVEPSRPATAASSAVADLRIDVFSYLPKGVLTVYAGSEQILLEPFRFVEKQGLLRRKKSAGRIETGVQLPAGSTAFRIYVAAEGRETQTVNLTAELTGGETHVLRLIIAENGSASAQLN